MRTLLLAAVLATSCGSYAASGGDPSPSPTVTANVVVTMASNNSTVTAHVGDHIQIALGEQFNWTLDPTDGIVLVHPLQSYMLVRGTQAIWLAKGPGRATIRAVGGAACPSGSACPMFAVLFNTTVDVLP